MTQLQECAGNYKRSKNQNDTEAYVVEGELEPTT